MPSAIVCIGIVSISFAEALHSAHEDLGKIDFEHQPAPLANANANHNGLETGNRINQPVSVRKTRSKTRTTRFNLAVCETVSADIGCTSWCLQPAWATEKGKATHLECCTGEQPEKTPPVAGDERPLIIGYLFTGESDQLRVHVKRWVQLPFQLLSRVMFLVVIDLDANVRSLWSEDPWGIVMEEMNNIQNQSQLPLVKMTSVDTFLPWNIGGKRNLLFKEAGDASNDPWVLMLDADLAFTPEFIDRAIHLTQTSDDGSAHHFNRVFPSGKMKMHPAAMLIRASAYWRSGGCDEDFVGHYGFTDPHFNYRAAQSGLRLPYHRDMVLQNLARSNRHIGIIVDKSAKHNAKVFGHKKKTGKWSNDYLRFKFGNVRRAVTPYPCS